MRLKYYLRGAGIAFFITTFLFVFLQNPSSQENSNLSQTVSTEVVGDTIDEAKIQKDKELTEEPKDLNTETSTALEDKASTETPTQTPIEIPIETPIEIPTETPIEEPVAEEIELTINGGEYSDVVSSKIAEQGLVLDHKEFNQFLITNGYDGKILPGNYKFTKGMTFDEIAKIITTP